MNYKELLRFRIDFQLVVSALENVNLKLTIILLYIHSLYLQYVIDFQETERNIVISLINRVENVFFFLKAQNFKRSFKNSESRPWEKVRSGPEIFYFLKTSPN